MHAGGMCPLIREGKVMTKAAGSSGRQLFVAPNGKPAGDGSLGKPLDTGTAFKAGGPAKAGDTLLLKAGLRF